MNIIPNTKHKGGLAPDKSKHAMRRPTPDSDAVASSDDEHTPHTRPNAMLGPTGRRPSSGWLHDIQPNRKFSLPSGSLGASGSHPNTPSHEFPAQGVNRSVTFNTTPWNTSFTPGQSN